MSISILLYLPPLPTWFHSPRTSPTSSGFKYYLVIQMRLVCLYSRIKIISNATNCGTYSTNCTSLFKIISKCWTHFGTYLHPSTGQRWLEHLLGGRTLWAGNPRETPSRTIRDPFCWHYINITICIIICLNLGCLKSRSRFRKLTKNLSLDPNLVLPDLETPVASFPIRKDESAVIVGEDGRVGRPRGLAV